MWNTSIEFLFLSGSQGPRFTAIKEGAEDAGSVYLDFGVFCQFAVGPHSLCQSGHGCGCFSDALVELCVEREGVRDGGTQVYEVMDVQHLAHDRRC